MNVHVVADNSPSNRGRNVYDNLILALQAFESYNDLAQVVRDDCDNPIDHSFAHHLEFSNWATVYAALLQATWTWLDKGHKHRRPFGRNELKVDAALRRVELFVEHRIHQLNRMAGTAVYETTSYQRGLTSLRELSLALAGTRRGLRRGVVEAMLLRLREVGTSQTTDSTVALSSSGEDIVKEKIKSTPRMALIIVDALLDPRSEVQYVALSVLHDHITSATIRSSEGISNGVIGRQAHPTENFQAAGLLERLEVYILQPNAHIELTARLVSRLIGVDQWRMHLTPSKSELVGMIFDRAKPVIDGTSRSTFLQLEALHHLASSCLRFAEFTPSSPVNPYDDINSQIAQRLREQKRRPGQEGPPYIPPGIEPYWTTENTETGNPQPHRPRWSLADAHGSFGNSVQVIRTERRDQSVTDSKASTSPKTEFRFSSVSIWSPWRRGETSGSSQRTAVAPDDMEAGLNDKSGLGA